MLATTRLAHAPSWATTSGLGAVGEEVPKELGPPHLSLSVLMASLLQQAGTPRLLFLPVHGAPGKF